MSNRVIICQDKKRKPHTHTHTKKLGDLWDYVKRFDTLVIREKGARE